MSWEEGWACQKCLLVDWSGEEHVVGGKFGLGTLGGGPGQRGGRSETGASFKKGEASCDAITAADWLGAECKRG